MSSFSINECLVYLGLFYDLFCKTFQVLLDFTILFTFFLQLTGYFKLY